MYFGGAPQIPLGDSLVTLLLQRLVLGRAAAVSVHPVAFAGWVGMLVTMLNALAPVVVPPLPRFSVVPAEPTELELATASVPLVMVVAPPYVPVPRSVSMEELFFSRGCAALVKPL